VGTLGENHGSGKVVVADGTSQQSVKILEKEEEEREREIRAK